MTPANESKFLIFERRFAIVRRKGERDGDEFIGAIPSWSKRALVSCPQSRRKNYEIAEKSNLKFIRSRKYYYVVEIVLSST